MTKCPYCGHEMVYQTRVIRTKTRIAYYNCPNCRAKSPQINVPLATSVGELAQKTTDASHITVAQQETTDRIYNLSLYLHSVQVMDGELFGTLMEHHSGMPGYTPHILQER